MTTSEPHHAKNRHADRKITKCGWSTVLGLADQLVGGAAVPADFATTFGDTGAGLVADILPAVALAASVPVAAVAITWADGTVTTVYLPEAPVRSANAIPGSCPRG